MWKQTLFQTVTMLVCLSALPGATALARDYPAIPQKVTSFGAAISENSLYIYGGHTGTAHEYFNEAQANTLWRLDLKTPKAWESLGQGPRLQGLAMVAHDGKLYRIGGFTAKNHEGDDHDLWSQAGVASYDPAAKQWHNLAPLPEPRSSFDAAVLDGKIYVVGGWQMQGDAKAIWHKTSHVLDLTSETIKWEALPESPFERRALAVAAHDGKLFAIGGMQREGGPTTRVDVFDPASGKWSVGPAIQGKGLEGFGCSSFAAGGRLYVTTMEGNLQRLSRDGNSWEIVRKLEQDRFFHRMLPFSDHQLLCVGGASMATGKRKEIDVIDVSSSPSKAISLTAPKLLHRARKARAAWKHFPGFSADVRVNVDGQIQYGTVQIGADRKVELSDPTLGENSQLQRTLKSLVDHRLRGEESAQGALFVDEDVDHPLGRLIRLSDSEIAGSTCRVKGDAIYQINRETRGGRFTISVFSVHRNKEGRTLPESYSVSSWDKTGALNSNSTVRAEWTRVGSFDLPASRTIVTAKKDSLSNVRFEFSNHQLTQPPAK